MNAIVTGAGRPLGIGAQISYALCEMGYNVFLTSFAHYDSSYGIIQCESSLEVPEYEAIIRQCRSYGVKAYFKSFDLTHSENVIDLFDSANECLGDIHVIVNNLCVHHFDILGSITEKDISESLNVNAKAMFLLCQEFYKRFNSSNGGRIVNLSSTQSLEPLVSEISYAISKASVPVITSTLAPIMAKKGITINAVNPGATNTGDVSDETIVEYKSANLFGRLGEPSDVANLVTFLISDKGKWITGQTINSEGGLFRGIAHF